LVNLSQGIIFENIGNPLRYSSEIIGNPLVNLSQWATFGINNKFQRLPVSSDHVVKDIEFPVWQLPEVVRSPLATFPDGCPINKQWENMIAIPQQTFKPKP
jgi:hypothetical protein